MTTKPNDQEVKSLRELTVEEIATVSGGVDHEPPFGGNNIGGGPGGSGPGDKNNNHTKGPL